MQFWKSMWLTQVIQCDFTISHSFAILNKCTACRLLQCSITTFHEVLMRIQLNKGTLTLYQGQMCHGRRLERSPEWYPQCILAWLKMVFYPMGCIVKLVDWSSLDKAWWTPIFDFSRRSKINMASININLFLCSPLCVAL